MVADELSIELEPLPVALVPGRTLRLRFQISNAGEVLDLAGTQTYFSINVDDSLPNARTLALVATPTVAAAIPEGPHRINLTADVRLPEAEDSFWTGPGFGRNYVITMRVDAFAEVPEWDEANNRRSISALVLANLPTTSLPGDYDFNGVVQRGDEAAWRSAVGVQGAGAPILADGDGNGEVDGADILFWQRRLGDAAPSASASTAPAVPAADARSLSARDVAFATDVARYVTMASSSYRPLPRGRLLRR